MINLSSDKIIRLITESFWVGAGIAISVILLFAGTRFLTTLLSSVEYGKLALAISLSTMIVQVCGNPVSQTAVRFFGYYREVGKLTLLLRIVGQSLLIQIGAIGCVCVIFLFFSRHYDGLPESSFILIIGLLAIFLLLNRIGFGIEDAARERRLRGVIQVGFEIGRFVIGIGLVVLFSCRKAEIVLLGFLIAAVFAVLSHGIFLHRLWNANLNTDSALPSQISLPSPLEIKKFQQPLYISNACIWIVMMAERWALQHYAGFSDVGGYVAVHQLAFMPMVLISTFLVLLLEPILYPLMGLNGKSDSAVHALRMNFYLAVFILSLTVLLFIGLLFFHTTIGNILLGENFRFYSWIFPWLLLAGGFFAASQQILLKFQCELRTQMLSVLWGIVAFIAVTAYFIGAHYWQLKGILLAVVLVNAILLLFSIIFLNCKHLQVKGAIRQEAPDVGA